jgi:NAD(P)H-flavin reductase
MIHIHICKYKDKEEVKIDVDSSEKGKKTPIIIETGETKKYSIHEKIKEIVITEPIKTFFKIIAGAVILYIAWYYGLKR